MQGRHGSEPPTVRPPYDPVAYARDSERALRAEEAHAHAARPTRRPPAPSPPVSPIPSTEDRASEGGQVLVELSVDDDDVPLLAVAEDRALQMPLSPISRTFLQHVNERDCVAVICARAGLRIDEAVIAIEELSGAGVVSFQRSTRYSSEKDP